ncbi:MAG: hypothetical protein ACOYN0_02580 [Phycisphaerales bacterium]
MAGMANGTLRDHDISIAEKSSGRFFEASGTINGVFESAFIMVGKLAGQSMEASAKLGTSEAVIERDDSPGYVYYAGTVTPNPSTKPRIRTTRLNGHPASECILVSVPPSSGTVSAEYLWYLGDEGSSLLVEIPAAYSSSGKKEQQTATSLRHYIRVLTDGSGKLYFANGSAQAIPTGSSDPIKLYYDEVTGYAASAGIDV